MMRDRDKAILKDLERFRCLSRDEIAELHFQNIKKPITSTNEVMRRLRDRGKVEVITSHAPYVYALDPSPIKKDSQKIQHYHAITSVYLDMIKMRQKPAAFQIEPKFGLKGTIEPDIFTIWSNRAWFIEVQRSVYSIKTWEEKMYRYIDFFKGEEWKRETWQPKDRKVFPYVLILSPSRVALPDGLPFVVMQSPSLTELLVTTVK